MTFNPLDPLNLFSKKEISKEDKIKIISQLDICQQWAKGMANYHIKKGESVDSAIDRMARKHAINLLEK
jgi:L-rhamnose mutarotase